MFTKNPIPKCVEHLIEFVKVLTSLSNGSSTFKRPNSKVVCSYANARVLSGDVENDVRTLPQVVPGTLLVLHLKNGAFGYQTSAI